MSELLLRRLCAGVWEAVVSVRLEGETVSEDDVVKALRYLADRIASQKQKTKDK